MTWPIGLPSSSSFIALFSHQSGRSRRHVDWCEPRKLIQERIDSDVYPHLQRSRRTFIRATLASLPLAISKRRGAQGPPLRVSAQIRLEANEFQSLLALRIDGCLSSCASAARVHYDLLGSNPRWSENPSPDRLHPAGPRLCAHRSAMKLKQRIFPICNAGNIDGNGELLRAVNALNWPDQDEHGHADSHDNELDG